MLRSIVKQWRRSALATGPRARLLAFLLGVNAGLGEHRRWARRAFHRAIGAFGSGDRVVLALRLDGRPMRLAMRRGDRADYLVAGELLQGGHDMPAIKPSRVVDAGGNIGTFAMAAAARFPGVPIVVYEPSRANVALLEENLRMNGIEATIVAKGVWSEPKTLYFQALDSYTGFVSDDPRGTAIECVIPEVAAADWLKLDVEGAEYEVLPELFGRGIFPYFVSLELHHRREKGDALIAMARSRGYEIRGPIEADTDCINLSLLRTTP